MDREMRIFNCDRCGIGVELPNGATPEGWSKFTLDGTIIESNRDVCDKCSAKLVACWTEGVQHPINQLLDSSKRWSKYQKRRTDEVVSIARVIRIGIDSIDVTCDNGSVDTVPYGGVTKWTAHQRNTAILIVREDEDGWVVESAPLTWLGNYIPAKSII